MAVSFAELAQGEVKGFPHYFQVKWKIYAHRRGEPFRFTLVTKDVEQEVEFIEEYGSHGRGDYGWYTVLIVCPVATLDTHDGLRIIRIEVDPADNATYI